MRDRDMYRGKMRDRKEWLEGYFAKPNGISVIILKEATGNYDGNIGKFLKTHDVILVDPLTICQCTGTPDKNDKNIYEGDIVRRELFGGVFIVGQVVWVDIGYCGFYLKSKSGYYPIGKDEHTGKSGCDEVIGNIFDNPELLKGDEE